MSLPFALAESTVPAWEAGAAALLGVLGLAAILWRMPRLRGTTLVAPAWWALVSLLAVTGVEVLVGLSAEGPASEWATPLRFAAAMGTFTPMMALLGAKRPQDRGWQFIVLSLWPILALPCGEWLLFGGVQEIHPARFWFLVILIAIGALNGIATRHWISSLLFCLGQLALLSPFLASSQGMLPGAQAPLVGLAGLVASFFFQATIYRRRAPIGGRLDRAWLDFRDAFGVVWSLRVAERINTSARMYDWPVMLAWHGFIPREGASGDVTPNDTAPVELPPAVEDSLRTLLRRFVSPEWIDARIIATRESNRAARAELPSPAGQASA